MHRDKIVGDGLNWQAIVIEEAETDIKLAIKRNLMGGSFARAKRDINTAIMSAVKELESEELKVKTKDTLQKFAYASYQKMLTDMGIGVAFLLYAFNSLRQGKSVRKVVTELAPAPLTNDALYDTQIAVPTLPYKDYYKRVENTLSKLSQDVAKYDKHISLRNIAEMTVRYEDTMANLDKLKADGVNLVQTSRHANCSKRCEPWQGGHYTLDNTYQTVDGILFQPLSNATDIYYTTKAGKTYKNGHITGFNCRHEVFPYRKGYEPPMVSAETVAKERAIDHKMRQYERNIRYYKDRALMFDGVDRDKYLKAKAKAITLNREYIAYAKSNNRAFYPSRTDIF